MDIASLTKKYSTDLVLLDGLLQLAMNPTSKTAIKKYGIKGNYPYIQENLRRTYDLSGPIALQKSEILRADYAQLERFEHVYAFWNQIIDEIVCGYYPLFGEFILQKVQLERFRPVMQFLYLCKTISGGVELVNQSRNDWGILNAQYRATFGSPLPVDDAIACGILKKLLYITVKGRSSPEYRLVPFLDKLLKGLDLESFGPLPPDLEAYLDALSENEEQELLTFIRRLHENPAIFGGILGISFCGGPYGDKPPRLRPQPGIFGLYSEPKGTITCAAISSLVLSDLENLIAQRSSPAPPSEPGEDTIEVGVREEPIDFIGGFPIERLEKVISLFQIAEKVRVQDIADILEVQRRQALELLVQIDKIVPGLIKLSGDDVVIAQDQIKDLASALGQLLGHLKARLAEIPAQGEAEVSDADALGPSEQEAEINEQPPEAPLPQETGEQPVQETLAAESSIKDIYIITNYGLCLYSKTHIKTIDPNLFAGFLTALIDGFSIMRAGLINAGLISSLAFPDSRYTFSSTHDLRFVIRTDLSSNEDIIQEILKEIQDIFFNQFPPGKTVWTQDLEKYKILYLKYAKFFEVEKPTEELGKEISKDAEEAREYLEDQMQNFTTVVQAIVKFPRPQGESRRISISDLFPKINRQLWDDLGIDVVFKNQRKQSIEKCKKILDDLIADGKLQVKLERFRDTKYHCFDYYLIFTGE